MVCVHSRFKALQNRNLHSQKILKYVSYDAERRYNLMSILQSYDMACICTYKYPQFNINTVRKKYLQQTKERYELVTHVHAGFKANNLKSS